MSIDLTQFYDTFFEECIEGLQLMESTLLSIPLDNPDRESVNAIFRVAHSIKGGSATFGFNNIVEFTHILETLLDQLREGELTFTQPMVNTMLSSVDCLEKIIQSFKQGNYNPTLDEMHRLEEVLQSYLPSAGGDAPIRATQPSSALAAVSNAPTVWNYRISFIPENTILLSGNDPYRIFKQLQNLGEFTAEVDASALPVLTALSSSLCYCRWNLTLQSSAEQPVIEHAFDWVKNECQLNITKTPVILTPAATVNTQVSMAAAPLLKGTKSVSETAKADELASSMSSKMSATGDSVRVSLEKMDEILNSVGELVITQLMLTDMCQKLDATSYRGIQTVLKQLQTQTRQLQEGVMGTRMLPLHATFNRFIRLIHDLSEITHKKVIFTITGESTELDKTVIEKIVDPLVHLLRNSVDHGIELPSDRVAKGKPEEGHIQLHAYQQGSDIYIELIDDGKGIDTKMIRERAIEKGMLDPEKNLTEEELYAFIFYPGFSTAQVVSEISGRGVGMDVVKRNIVSVGGNVRVESEMDKGTRILIKLPLTLAIMDGQLCKVSNQTFIIPMLSIVESIPVTPVLIKNLPGEQNVFPFRGQFLPLISIRTLFNLPSSANEGALIVVIESTECQVGILVDELTSQQQIVIKNLEANYQRVQGLSGATILGSGKVALILDMVSLIEMAKTQGLLISKNNYSEARLA